ncbi:hypothetical protein WR25_08916 [Diploscapter pachys]|uniref:Uncharacterized protein n=1 Tax=Diploscapter pachys TaxID=2018661 RepID=A0A2A2KN08_9BILA|nr:hypothetical protein WR25_08916 [Diploscapter pachys]
MDPRYPSDPKKSMCTLAMRSSRMLVSESNLCFNYYITTISNPDSPTSTTTRAPPAADASSCTHQEVLMYNPSDYIKITMAARTSVNNVYKEFPKMTVN